jgi:hypothetical protein
MIRSNARRQQARRLRDFGSRERIAIINAMPCVCAGNHPECTGGWSEPSHIVSRGAGGRAADIVPMSTVCHAAWHHGRASYLEQLGLDDDAMARAAEDTDRQTELELEAMP